MSVNNINNIFHISDQTPGISGPLPVNRMVFSSFTRYEAEKQSLGFSLKVPLQGKEKYIIGNKAYSVGPGEYFLVNHGQLVGYELKHKNPIKGFCLFMDEKVVQQSLSTLSRPESHLLDQPDHLLSEEIAPGKFVFEHNHFADLIGQLALHEHPKNHPEALDYVFYELVLELARQILQHQARRTQLGTKKKSTQEEIYNRLQTARQFLHDQLHMPLTIKQIADCASFSEFHFIRLFKSCFGISPYQYLTRIRVEKAKEMIRQQHYPMAEIAIICGFHDECMFSKIFKKQTGMPPSIYRNRIAQKVY